MKNRLAILTEIIAPYRIPVFNALASRLEVDLHVIFLTETDTSLRQWKVYRDEMRFSHEVLHSYRLRLGSSNVLFTCGMRSALERAGPHVILGGGYNYPATWQALRWAGKREIPFLLWSESNAVDARGSRRWVEAAKRRFINSCQGYVVPGSSAAAYLKEFGVGDQRIYVAPNAVDVERFSRLAVEARRQPELRSRLGLPSRYLLYVGRFVRPKGVFDLLEAYATLPQEIRQEVGLVLAGDGEERERLRQASDEIRPGKIVFPGFLQRDELAPLYAFAEALLLPTHSDTWGLVVNEALACGLPVIVTNVAGCAADLVRNGENGFVVAPGNPAGLAETIHAFLRSEARSGMARRAQELGMRFTPQAWAQGVVEAVAGVVGERVG